MKIPTQHFMRMRLEMAVIAFFIFAALSLLVVYVASPPTACTRRLRRGQLRPVDAPLAARAISGLVLGLLVLQMRGDDYLATHGPAVAGPLAALLFDGMRPDTKRTPDGAIPPRAGDRSSQ